MHSLRKLVWLAFLVVSLLLAAIILLGAYQYQLAGKYNNVIDQNERALFHFITIREAITETMISNEWKGLDRVFVDIEMLNSELSRLKENKLVSAELKLALVDKIDLAGLAILLRQVINGAERTDRSKILQERLRSIADYLLQYDRIIVGQARARIVNFQMFVIGALGLVVSLASFSLILLHRNTVVPLLEISRQLQSEEFFLEGLHLERPVVREVDDLAAAIDTIAHNRSKIPVEADQSLKNIQTLLAVVVNENTNRLNGIINYAQLLFDSAEQTQMSEEQRDMVQKIIDSGVRMAEEWQKIK